MVRKPEKEEKEEKTINKEKNKANYPKSLKKTEMEVINKK